VSLIVSLEQFSLASILRGIESTGKTGLLKIRRGEKWVELYFRQGQLICIGPIQSNLTLGDRLLQAGIISQQALQEALAAIGESQLSETRIVLTLIDLGYVSHESLYAWAAKEAAEVINVLLAWRTGEFGFEEELQPPIDRLLIALSVSSLLPSDSSKEPAYVETTSAAVQKQGNQAASVMNISDPPTLVLPAQFFPEKASASHIASSSFLSIESLVTLPDTKSGPSTPPPLSAPKRITRPLAPIGIDTSFMAPGMVLIPTDLSELRGQNLELELSPEQWRLMTQANGHTSLQEACLALEIPPERICQMAGELIALGLITVSSPSTEPLNASSSAPKELVAASVGSGQTSSAGHPRTAVISTADPARSFSGSGPHETVSQWGNGGSRATFVLGGGGWVVATHSSQPLRLSGPLNVPHPVYAQSGSVS
jgi:hypothetical protein